MAAKHGVRALEMLHFTQAKTAQQGPGAAAAWRPCPLSYSKPKGGSQMTRSQKKAAEARRVLVHAVREARRRNLKRHYLEIEERIIPCCASCEHNRAAVCTARPVPGFEPYHRYGHTITDPEDLCIMWGASYDAFCKAFSRARPNSPPPPCQNQTP